MGGTTAFMDNFAYDGGDIKRSDNANEQHTPVDCKTPDYGVQTTYFKYNPYTCEDVMCICVLIT